MIAADGGAHLVRLAVVTVTTGTIKETTAETTVTGGTAMSANAIDNVMFLHNFHII